MDNQRNFILAAVLSLAVVFLWQMFIIGPRIEKERAAVEAQSKLEKQTSPESSIPAPSSQGASGVPQQQTGQLQAGSGVVPGGATETPAGATVGRVPFRSEKVDGSINLKGARIDDLNLAQYRQTVDPSSPEIRLLKPVNNENAYFAEFGFSPNAEAGQLPGPGTVWALVEGDTLTPSSPIVLEYKNDRGIQFRRKIELDDEYMFTIADTVSNTNNAAVAIKPYGRIARYGKPEVAGIYVLHEGLVGAVGEQGLDEYDYGDIEEERQVTRERAEKGWLGITDKYWATALIPGSAFVAHYNYYADGRPFYQSDFLADALTIPAGGEASTTNRLFAGAKKVDIIDAYRDNLNIPLFDKIIDWGWFYWLTKPLFGVMNWIYQLVGNFGVAILGVTVLFAPTGVRPKRTLSR